MDTLSVGHPIFELAQMYFAYQGFSETDHEAIRRFLGISRETGAKFWTDSLKFYFAGTMELLYCIMMMISAFMVYESLDSMSSFTALMRNIRIAVTQTKEILDMPPMDIDGEELTPEVRDIELRNVGFSYDKRKIIDGVSLTIPEKTTTAFVGPSGGGKTTLCHLMARFWDVQEGEVLLGGKNVKDYSFDCLMKNFSFVSLISSACMCSCRRSLSSSRRLRSFTYCHTAKPRMSA
jgi:ABC-type multidrug transport system fused ATPase/permease subunit